MTKMNPVVHFEMPYEDADRVVKFYSDALGWQMNPLGKEMNDYVLAQTTETDAEGMIKEPGNINGGFFPKNASPHPYPSVVIAVEDVAASSEAVKAAGGEIQGFPVDIPGVGKFVSFTDTEGNWVGLLQPLKM